MERIVSRALMEQLFTKGNSRTATAFPLRAVYMERQRTEGAPPVEVLVSVSKRHFKRAVKRNRVKRQIREAYRLQKQILTVHVPQDRSVALAFIWMDDNLCDSAQVSASVRHILKKVSEKL